MPKLHTKSDIKAKVAFRVKPQIANLFKFSSNIIQKKQLGIITEYDIETCGTQ